MRREEGKEAAAMNADRSAPTVYEEAFRPHRSRVSHKQSNRILYAVWLSQLTLAEAQRNDNPKAAQLQ